MIADSVQLAPITVGALMNTKQTIIAGERTRWSKGEYKVATNPKCNYIEDQTDTRQGYVFGKLFGIDKRMWSVTHLPTGLKMPGYFSRLRDAKAYVTSLLPLTDWLTVTVDNSTERFTPIKSQILNIMQEHGI